MYSDGNHSISDHFIVFSCCDILNTDQYIYFTGGAPLQEANQVQQGQDVVSSKYGECKGLNVKATC